MSDDGNPGPASEVLLTASNAMIQSGDGKKNGEEEDGENIGGGVQPLETLQDDMNNLLPGNEEEEEAHDEEEESQVHEPQYYPNNRLDKQSKSSRAPRRSPTSRSNTARNSNQPIETTAEDPEGLAEEFEQGATISKADSETLAKTVIELEKRSENQNSNGGTMKDTLRIQMAIEKAKIAQRESCKRETQRQALKENQDKQEKVKEDLRRAQKDMKEREKMLIKKNNDYLESLEARHKEERKDLDSKWKNDITVQRRYNRSSQQLRTLRLTQERLMRVKKFSDSANIGQIADRLEQEEINRNFDAMNKDYLLAVKSLEERQKEEMELAEAVNNRRLEEYQAMCESKKRPYMRRLANLKKEEEEIMASPDNVWNLKHRNDGDTVTSIVGPREKKNQEHSLTAKDNKYNTLKLPKLNINTSSTSAASNYRTGQQSQASNRQSQNGVSVHDNEEEEVNNEEEGEHENAPQNAEEEEKGEHED